MNEEVKAFDYTRKRTTKEACIFYAGGVILGIALSVLVKYLFAVTIWGEEVPKYYYLILIYLFTTIYTLIFAIKIMYDKKLWKNIRAVILSIFSLILAPIFGLIVSFIPIAVLMTFEPVERENNV